MGLRVSAKRHLFTAIGLRGSAAVRAGPKGIFPAKRPGQLELVSMSKLYDIVIKGGTIIDGMRTPRYVADIGIKSGRIACMGGIDPGSAARLIDAHGLIVAPGFIDLHTHYDSQVFWDPYCSLSGWHGVTSVVIGNCGFGFAPCHSKDRERAMQIMSRNEAVPVATMKAGMPWDWVTFPEFLESIKRTPKGVNMMTYLPLNPLLMYVMGLEAAKNRPGTADERRELRRLFIEALDAGACGFSAQYTGTENVQRDSDGTPMITDVMAREDLFMFAEILRERGEGFIQIACAPAVAEDLARVSGRPVVWNALAAGADQHGAPTLEHRAVLKWLDEANGRGNRVFAQANTTSFSFVFTLEDWNLFDASPLWRDATLGTPGERLRKLADPEVRRRLREEHDAGKGPIAGGALADDNALGFAGLEAIFLIASRTGRYAHLEGKSLAEIGSETGKHPVDAFLDIAVDEELKAEFQTPEVKAKSSAMREIVQSPFALPGISDGGAHTKFITLSTYATDFIVDHVRTNGYVELEEAHWRLSAYSALAAGLRDRGMLREGLPADVIVYDYDELASLPMEVAHDYPANEWRRIRKAKGYRYIIVNGEITFIDGECTGATPGRLLEHGFDSQSAKRGRGAARDAVGSPIEALG